MPSPVLFHVSDSLFTFNKTKRYLQDLFASLITKKTRENEKEQFAGVLYVYKKNSFILVSLLISASYL
jgi:hypothetical protein